MIWKKDGMGKKIQIHINNTKLKQFTSSLLHFLFTRVPSSSMSSSSSASKSTTFFLPSFFFSRFGWFTGLWYFELWTWWLWFKLLLWLKLRKRWRLWRVIKLWCRKSFLWDIWESLKRILLIKVNCLRGQLHTTWWGRVRILWQGVDGFDKPRMVVGLRWGDSWNSPHRKDFETFFCKFRYRE